jgi:hypothetical protein
MFKGAIRKPVMEPVVRQNVNDRVGKGVVIVAADRKPSDTLAIDVLRSVFRRGQDRHPMTHSFGID